MINARVNATTFLLGLQQALLIPVLTLYAVRGLHLGPLGLVVFLAVYHGVGLFVSLAVPAIADRRDGGGFYFLVLTLLAVIGFSAFAFPLNGGVAVLVAAFTVGPASAQNSVFFSTLATAGASRAGLISTRGLFTVAWVVGPVGGIILHATVGFAGIFAVLAGVNAVVLIVSPRWPRGAPPAIRLAQTSPVRGAALRVFLGFIALVFLYGTNVIATTTMPLIVSGLPGGSSTISGVAFATSAVLEAAILFALARWTSGRNEATLILLGCAPGAVYYVFLACTLEPWAVIPAQIANALFISTTVGLGMTWFQSLWVAQPGLSTGLFMNASRIASLVTAPLIGLSAAWTQSYQVINWFALALLAPAIAILLALRTAGSSESTAG